MKPLFLVGLLASLSFGAITPVQVPYLIDSAVTPQVTYIDQNDAALQNKINQVVDSVNLYIGGALKASRVQSTGSLNVTLDSDNNQTNQKFSVTNNGQADTLLKVDETQRRTRVFGNVTVDSSLAVGGSATIGGGVSINGNISGVDSLKFSSGGGKIIDFGAGSGNVQAGGAISYDATAHLISGDVTVYGVSTFDSGSVTIDDSLDAETFKATKVIRNTLYTTIVPVDTIVIDSSHHILVSDLDTVVYVLPNATTNPGRELIFRAYPGSVVFIHNPSNQIIADIAIIPLANMELPYQTQDGGAHAFWGGVTLVSIGDSWWVTSSTTVEIGGP